MNLSLVLLSAFLLPVYAVGAPGLTVQTQQGPVVGTLVVPTVRQFLGIPYATADRWKPPHLPAVRKGVFQATKFGDSCIQELSPPNVEFLKLAGGLGINVTSSEDCMSVNIWAPSVERKQKTSVMIWIYGGGFVFGTSNIPVYDGQNFVRDNDDVTIVTFNYRTNIFGQPNAPQLGKDNLNFGLLDIDAAVQWVHANIANFGGDPDRIILFGQSAGAAATDAYTFAHPNDTIVKGKYRQARILAITLSDLTIQGVIQESGSISGSGVLVIASTSANQSAWNTVAASVGCGQAPTPSQFACMQKTEANTLENAVVSTGATFNLVIDNTTIFADTNARAANGQFLHVPLLGGTAANEDDIFIVAQELVTAGIVIPSVTEMLSDVETLLGFTCPAGVTALHRINANVPTWRYQHQAVFPDISTRPDLRAYHASEIPLVFGTYNVSDIPATQEEVALSRYIQSAWVAFARNPAQGLLDFGWPMYNPNTTSLAQLGNAANQTGVVFTQGNLVDFACGNQAALIEIQNQLLGILGA
uniref:Carboxylic ester hydrolase n=1 Tax=Psilocybe cubensis TaxID=181762 RepID=A0A8H7Y880_PSICU